MRREHNDPFTLTIDCPLNNSLIDQSGNNHNLSVYAGGTAYYVTDPTDASIKVSRLTSDAESLQTPAPPNQIDFINKFKIEIDFYKLSTWNNVYYPNLLDASNSGGNNGIFSQKVSKTVYFGLTSGGVGYHLAVSTSGLSLNTWYHLLIQNIDNLLTVKIIRNSDNVELYNYSVNTPTITSVYMNPLFIGRGGYSGRQWGGYAKNFKLFT